MWEVRNPPKTLRITARLAKEFAEMDRAPGERPLRERRIEVYQGILNRSEFRPVTWAKAFCVETGITYRVNGQHTSLLFGSVNLSTVQDLYASVEDYNCPTLEDVSKLYSTFDNASQSRNITEINRAFAATIPELAGLSNSIVNLFVSGIHYWANPTPHGGGSTHQGMSAADRAEALFENVDFCI